MWTGTYHCSELDSTRISTGEEAWLSCWSLLTSPRSCTEPRVTVSQCTKMVSRCGTCTTLAVSCRRRLSLDYHILFHCSCLQSVAVSKIWNLHVLSSHLQLQQHLQTLQPGGEPSEGSFQEHSLEDGCHQEQ